MEVNVRLRLRVWWRNWFFWDSGCPTADSVHVMMALLWDEIPAVPVLLSDKGSQVVEKDDFVGFG